MLVVEGRTSATAGGEKPFDILAYNNISEVIFFEIAIRGASSLLNNLFLGTKPGTEILSIPMNALL